MIVVMATKIRVLTDDTINKIAAGEVIENAASVVKELVENSLDAGANDICVEIRGGGRQLIRVTDNGCGMGPDDALLCFERHATSKLREVDDLEQISTLGFRGEAVPSIAAISKFTLLTRTTDAKDDQGTMVIVEGGRIMQSSPAARNAGTTIEIKGLFFNVPARRKFQKAPAHDAAEVLKVLTSLALAKPDVAFELISDQEHLLKTRRSSADTWHERIKDVLGAEFIEQCVSVEKTHDGCHLVGYVGKPTQSRPNRTGQHLFINGRAVQSALISHLVREAYGSALPTQRHPQFVLVLTVPGDLIDVNVHPQKREVRLRQNETLRTLILSGVGQVLQIAPQPSLQHNAAAFQYPTYTPRPLPTPSALPWETTPEPLIRPAQQPSQINEGELFCEQKVVPKVVATIPGYCVLESMTGFNPSALLLLDQRAAHHRVIFDRLRKQDSGPIQPLLIPITLEFSPVESTFVAHALPNLQSLGIEIESFGAHTFLVRAIPDEWDSENLHGTITELVEKLQEWQSSGIKQQERDKQLALAASRLTFGRKQRLSQPEAQELIHQLFKCDTPLQCPQGRPIIAQIDEKILAKQFER